MLLRLTRVHEKLVRFHISPPEYVKNAPGFTLPNRDRPKTNPVLGPNLRRRTFGSVCNTPLYGYVKNPSDFTFPNKDTPKTRPILDPNLRRGYLRGVCFCALHGYVQNLTGLGLKSSAGDIWGRMQYAPTRIRAKFGGFWTQTFDEDCFGAYAIRPYMDTCKTRPVSYFRTRIHPKPARL